MGWNTTVILMNDALDDIRQDPDFGKKLVSAASAAIDGKRHDVSALGHVNAATVIETHHADHIVPVLIGGNTGQVVKGTYIGWADDEKEITLLRQLAEKHGMRLSKKPARKAGK
jgi:hypothetical protein